MFFVIGCVTMTVGIIGLIYGVGSFVFNRIKEFDFVLLVDKTSQTFKLNLF